MDPVIYSILHVVSLILLTAFTFQAFAAPKPEARKGIMMITGILSLVMVVAGFGLISKLGYEFSAPWILIKLVCWLALSALAGVAFRKPGLAGVLKLVATAIIVVAVYCVYMKPGV